MNDDIESAGETQEQETETPQDGLPDDYDTDDPIEVQGASGGAGSGGVNDEGPNKQT